MSDTTAFVNQWWKEIGNTDATAELRVERQEFFLPLLWLIFFLLTAELI